MAKLIDVTIKVSRGVSSAGENMAAEISASYQVERGDSDLTTVVTSKFHEVRNALIQVLEAEPPIGTAAPGRVNVEEPQEKPEGVEEAIAASTAGELTEANRNTPIEEDLPAGDIPMEDTAVTTVKPALSCPNVETATKDATVTTSAVNDLAAPSTTPEASAYPRQETGEAPPEPVSLTPAQERTVRSLIQAAGLAENELQTILETGFNRKSVQDLTKREAASLILKLSQRNRQRLLRDKTELPLFPERTPQNEESIARNGSVH